MAGFGARIDRWLGPLAALALALATAFFVYAMPEALIGQGVAATGIPILPRETLVPLAAMVAGLPTLLLFRLLDRPAMPGVRDEGPDDRADLVRTRPLFADSEVGEPMLLDRPIAPRRHNTGQEDVFALIDRLEAGLARRKSAVIPPVQPRVTAKVMPIHGAFPLVEPADDALRNALAELQRIAGQRA